MQETTARVQFDKKYLIALVLPLVIEQVLAVTVGMADMIMVSGAGDTAVSGVSLVNTISNLLIYIFNALATGGAVVAAQALGAKKKKTGQIVANQLVLICLIVSVVISAVCIVFDRAILTLIYGKVEQAVMDQAVTYFFITGFSFPFIAVYDGASSLLRSMGKASISLFVSAIMNGLNILFNAIFVFGYNMGIAGVGYGTLISRVVAGIVVVFILRNEKYDLHIDKYFRFGWDGQIIGKILRIGIPSGIDNGMFQIGKLFTQSLITSYGTAAIAANATGSTIELLATIPAAAMGLALTTVVGQCVGAGDYQSVKEYSWKLMKWAYVMLWGLNIVIIFMTPTIASWYNLSAEASNCASWLTCPRTRLFMTPTIASWYNLSAEADHLARILIWYHSACCMVMWPAAWTLPSILRAAGDVKFVMVSSIIIMWVFRIGLAYVIGGLMQPMGLGVWGVWIAMTIDWFARCVCNAWRLKSGKWKRGAVI